MDSREHLIAFGGGDTWCRVVGSPNEGTPIVVLHGGPGYPSYYLENLANLARPDRAVIIYDQMSCGRSTGSAAPEDWTIQTFVDQYEVVRSHFGLSTVDLIGHSWGAFLGLELAIRLPHTIRRLVLASGSASAHSFVRSAAERARSLPADMYAAIERADATGEFDTPEFFAANERFLADFCNRIDPLPWGLATADDEMNVPMYKHMWGSTEFRCDGTLSTWDRRADLSNVELPVLITSGRYDEGGPFAQEELLAGLPNSHWQVFPNSAHHPHVTDEVAWLNAVDEFLTQ